MTQADRRSPATVLAGALAAVVGSLALVWCATTGSAERARTVAPRDDTPAASPGSTRGGVGARSTSVAGVGKVSGVIVDDDGNPVGGGAVTLSCLDDDGHSGVIVGGTMSLDDDGAFEGPACAGIVCVGYRHATHTRPQAWTLSRGERATLVARPLPRLYGEVHDDAGDPIENATVVVGAPRDDPDPTALLPVVTPSTSTDADGSFSVARVVSPPCDPCSAAQGCGESGPTLMDRVVISARAAGYGPAQIDVELDGGQGTDPDRAWVVILPASAPPITGTFLDTAGGAYPRAFVLARSQQRPGEQHRGEASDGAFAVDGLGEGAYSLRAIQDGIELATGVAQAGDRVVLRPTHEGSPRALVVQLVDDGRPVTDATVQGGPFSDATTDAAGEVRAGRVAPGTYILRVDRQGPSGRTKGSATVEVKPGREGTESSEQEVTIDVAGLQFR